MKPRLLVWLAVCVGLVLAWSASAPAGWVLGTVVAAALVLSIPLGVKRYRLERDLARKTWRALTTR
jgi:hypothetical protein